MLRENRSTPHILFPSKGKIVCTWIELRFLEKRKHSLDLHSIVSNLKGSVVRRSFDLSLIPLLSREKKGWILGSGMIEEKNNRALVGQERDSMELLNSTAKNSIELLPAHIIHYILFEGGLGPIDLASLEATCYMFRAAAGFEPCRFKSIAELAARHSCHRQPLFLRMPRHARLQLLARCDGNWKLVLRFLQALEQASQGGVATSTSHKTVSSHKQVPQLAISWHYPSITYLCSFLPLLLSRWYGVSHHLQLSKTLAQNCLMILQRNEGQIYTEEAWSNKNLTLCFAGANGGWQVPQSNSG